jgi:hypothetical protein
MLKNSFPAPPSLSPALKGGDGGAFFMQWAERKLKIRLPSGSGKCGFSVSEGRRKEPAEGKAGESNVKKQLPCPAITFPGPKGW